MALLPMTITTGADRLHLLQAPLMIVSGLFRRINTTLGTY
jgi:hypothetical protein